MARIEEKKKKQLAQEDAFVQVKRWPVLAPPLEKRLRDSHRVRLQEMLVAYNDDSEGLMNEVRQFLEEREMSDLQKKQHLCATPLQARLDLP
jgi:hypothetical protein